MNGILNQVIYAFAGARAFQPVDDASNTFALVECEVDLFLVEQVVIRLGRRLFKGLKMWWKLSDLRAQLTEIKLHGEIEVNSRSVEHYSAQVAIEFRRDLLRRRRTTVEVTMLGLV